MFEANDVTYADGSRKSSYNFIMESGNLVSCDVYFAPEFNWTPKDGIFSMRAFGAKDKFIYKFYGRYMKRNYLLKRLRQWTTKKHPNK